MADYRFTTTDEQEALLSWIVKQGNEQKDTNYSNVEYVQLRFPELLVPYAASYHDELQKQISHSFASADKSTQLQVLALLKVE